VCRPLPSALCGTPFPLTRCGSSSERRATAPFSISGEEFSALVRNRSWSAGHRGRGAQTSGGDSTLSAGTRVAPLMVEATMAGRITQILVATDFSPASEAALAWARDLAQQYAARLSLLHVVTDPGATEVFTAEV